MDCEDAAEEPFSSQVAMINHEWPADGQGQRANRPARVLDVGLDEPEEPEDEVVAICEGDTGIARASASTSCSPAT